MLQSRDRRSGVRVDRVLSRAVQPVLEWLEDRRLMSVTAPFALEFDAPVAGSLVDADGQGTGFTSVQVNKLGNQYQPGLIDLRPDLGKLFITSSGTATAGSNRDTDNTLTNALQVELDASGVFTITTRLSGPLGFLDVASEQGGLMFGPNQDNWVKLVASATSSGQRLQLSGEQSGTTAGSIVQFTDTRINVGSFAAITTLDLRLTGEASTGKLTASYSINGAAFVTVSPTITVSTANRAAFFNADAKGGLIVVHKNNSAPVTVGFDRFAVLKHPSITLVDPAPGAINVSRDVFVGADLSLPNGALDAATVNSGTVTLVETATGAAVPGVANSSGGGDSVVFQPSGLLKSNTQYTFTATSGVKDLSGLALTPYTMSFTTGTAGGPPDSNIAFEKVSVSSPSHQYTAVTVGPDHRLYAGTITGRIIRFDINPSGTLANPVEINTIRAGNGNADRMLIGFTFDPASTADDLVMWVSHGHGAFDDAPDWTGKITRLRGPNLGTYEDAVVGLPRAAHNHLTNQPVFGPDGKLYVQTGGNTAQGAMDSTWGHRPERLLGAAMLQVDVAALDPTVAALDVKTEDGGSYDPWAPGAIVKIFATGLRNAYDMVWTTDGKLYAANNGSNPGGATPATPALPVFGSVRIDGDDDADPTNGMYAGPAVPGINPVTVGQADHLFLVEQGGYYGHPNPTRAEYVLHGGNPTAGSDPNQITNYPVGTLPDRNYRPPAFSFGAKYSPNGIIEYGSTHFGGGLAGRLLVVRFSGGDDIMVMHRNAAGTITGTTTGLPGMTGFVDPLDLVEDAQNGNLYVAEYGGKRITLLRPLTPPDAPTDPKAAVKAFDEVVVTWTAAPKATSYRVQRKGPADADFIDVGTSTTTSLTDSTAAANTPYQYRVRAENQVGSSAYAPAVGVTTPMPSEWFDGVDLPVATSEAGGAVINGKLYVVGEATDATWIFDFSTQAWSTGATRPHTGDATNREHFVEAVGAKLYVIGGLSGTAVNKTQVYDTATNTWSIGADLPFSAGSGSSAVIGGQIYVAGGAVMTPTYGPVAKVARYNPATDAWTLLPDMPLPRHANSYGTDGTRLYVFGGRTAGLEASAGTDTVQVYDPATGWTTRTPAPRQSRGTSRAVFHDGEFYVLGGESSFPTPDGAVFNTVDIYNPTTDTWRLGPVMPTPRHALLGVEHQNKIYTVGGGVVRGTSQSKTVEVLDLLADGIPTAPTNLSAVSPTFDKVNLAWADNSLGESGFQVLRSTDNVNFSVLATTAAGATAYTDATTAGSTTYHYQVKALAAAGGSAASNTAAVTTAQAVAPAAPTNLVATPIATHRVDLSWTASAGAALYRVERKGSGQANFTEVGTSATPAYVDSTGLDPQNTYEYRVRAENVAGQSPYGGVASATTPLVDPMLSVNVNTTGGSTTALGGGNFDVVATGLDIWNSADSFRFLYEQRTGDFDVKVQIQGLAASSTSAKAGLMVRQTLDANSKMIFSGATPGSGYKLSQRASTGAKVANTFSGGTPSFPNVWVRLQRVGNVFSGSYSTNGTTWTSTGTVTMTLPSTVYFGLATASKSSSATATAQYRSYGDAGVPLPPAPAAPTSLTATPVSASGVDLAWTDNANNETGFEVLRSTDNVTFSPVGTTGANSTTFSDMTVAGGTLYQYRVRATNAGGASGNSNTAQATTPVPPAPGAPAMLTATAGGPTTVNLSWATSTGATVYRVERRVAGGSFAEIGTATGVTYTDTTASAATTYDYRVRAENAGGQSGYSPVASATTPAVPQLTSVNINTTAAGSTTVLDETAGNYDVAGSGTDIFGTADSFRFIYQQLTGDFDVRVQVTSLEQLQATTKAGLVGRESLAANSKSVFSGVTASDGYRFGHRTTTGGTTTNLKGTAPAFPNVWVRLTRVGDTFTGYISSDGSTWTTTGSQAVVMSTQIYVGMAVASKSTTTTVDTSFRNYDVV